jgi:hypothetical protein
MPSKIKSNQRSYRSNRKTQKIHKKYKKRTNKKIYQQGGSNAEPIILKLNSTMPEEPLTPEECKEKIEKLKIEIENELRFDLNERNPRRNIYDYKTPLICGMMFLDIISESIGSKTFCINTDSNLFANIRTLEEFKLFIISCINVYDVFNNKPDPKDFIGGKANLKYGALIYATKSHRKNIDALFSKTTVEAIAAIWEIIKKKPRMYSEYVSKYTKKFSEDKANKPIYNPHGKAINWKESLKADKKTDSDGKTISESKIQQLIQYYMYYKVTDLIKAHLIKTGGKRPISDDDYHEFAKTQIYLCIFCKILFYKYVPKSFLSDLNYPEDLNSRPIEHINEYYNFNFDSVIEEIMLRLDIKDEFSLVRFFDTINTCKNTSFDLDCLLQYVPEPTTDEQGKPTTDQQGKLKIELEYLQKKVSYWYEYLYNEYLKDENVKKLIIKYKKSFDVFKEKLVNPQ